MIDDRLKIAITDKETDAILDAPRRDEGVDRLANRYPSSSRKAVVSSRFDPDIKTPGLNWLQRGEHARSRRQGFPLGSSFGKTEPLQKYGLALRR
ncbi:hypothetical protein [Sphingomonas oryzagri]